MGCVNSREHSAEENKQSLEPGTNESGLSNRDKMSREFKGPLVTGGPLTQKDYNKRIVSSGSTQTVDVLDQGYSLSYAYVSQRGYYPESMDKPNQDCFCVHTKFGGDPNCHLFGVFDGHGEHGTPCAQFARDRVRVLATFYSQDWVRRIMRGIASQNQEYVGVVRLKLSVGGCWLLACSQPMPNKCA
jgi:hypothetical protein